MAEKNNLREQQLSSGYRARQKSMQHKGPVTGNLGKDEFQELQVELHSLIWVFF